MLYIFMKIVVLMIAVKIGLSGDLLLCMANASHNPGKILANPALNLSMVYGDSGKGVLNEKEIGGVSIYD